MYKQPGTVAIDKEGHVWKSYDIDQWHGVFCLLTVNHERH